MGEPSKIINNYESVLFNIFDQTKKNKNLFNEYYTNTPGKPSLKIHRFDNLWIFNIPEKPSSIINPN